jgi:hypothetical protein
MPRKPPKFKIYDTQAQFCAGENVALALAKRAKQENCPYVLTGGRYDARTKAWIDEQNWEQEVYKSKEQLECERIEKQNRKLDRDHQKAMKELIPIEEVREGLAQIVQISQGIMRDFLEKSVQNKAFTEYKKRLKEMDL